VTLELRIATVAGDLGRAAADLEAFLQANDVPPRRTGRASVLLEEVVMNALRHGGASAVRVHVTLAPEACRMTFEDDGPAFDPTTAPLPARARSLDDETVGGRGLLLIRRFADRLAYRRDGGMNRLEATIAAR
jgi:serine/threonine-protein kinase RsbW